MADVDALKSALAASDAMGPLPIDAAEQPCPLKGEWEVVETDIDHDHDVEAGGEADGA
jgi:hypothetical protein